MTTADIALGLAVGLFAWIVAQLLFGAWRYVRRVNRVFGRISGQ